MMVTGIVNNVWTKDVEIKRGARAGSTAQVRLFSLEGDSSKYSLGFGKHDVKVGDQLTFNTHAEKFGEVPVDMDTFKIESRGNTVAKSDAVEKKKTRYSKGTFPVPFDDGQRAILRQHAVTQARELYSKYNYAEDGEPLNDDDFDEAVHRILRIASQIEFYTSGDNLRPEEDFEVDE